MTYPNDAFAFDVSKSIETGDDDYSYDDDPTGEIVGGLFGVLFVAGIIVSLVNGFIRTYTRSAGFSAPQKKITRTKVVYYPTCQGCGAARPDGANNCAYCGRSFIKSEEIITEKDIPAEEAELRKKKTDGLYGYSSDPNTFVRVHVVPVPVSRSSSSSSSRGGGSSCAHSSCACACAFAGACAGGGRAGCSVKDFYQTDLKLKQLEIKTKRRKG